MTAGVGLVAAQDDRLAAADLLQRVDSGQESLRGRLFVARGAVDLAGEEEAVDAANLQRRLELLGVHEVVLDRVAVARDHGVFESGQRADDGVLHVRRQRGRDAVEVEPGMRQAPPARRRPDGAPSRRSGRPCPRSTGSSAGRWRGSGRSTSARGGGSRGSARARRSLV